MRRVLFLSAALSVASLLGGCGKNQCTHVVERTCSDIRAKAQQYNPNQAPTPDELCPAVDWKGREKLKDVCTSANVRSFVADVRVKSPLNIAAAMCDGMKLHILTPTVEELTECRINEEAAEQAAKDRAAGKKVEEPAPAPAPKPVSVPASSSAPASSTSTPAGTSQPAGTPPAGTPPTGAPAGTPPQTPPAGAPTTPPAAPPA